ncbi:MAG: hypothetical protein EB830_00015 [Nitrosopumilus sp. H13]|nr:MAG: hypothetical protein EB830_00015 [Nitrosopumilus sp. H13]
MTRDRRTDIRGRIARILLNDPHGNLTKYRVAKLANSSYPWTHSLLKELEDEDITVKTKVKNFREFLAWWRRHQSRHTYRAYMVRDPQKLLAEAGLPYALTTYHAENKVQSYLFPSRIDFYIRHSDRTKWHEMIIKDGLVGKGNVRVLLGDEHVFYKSHRTDGVELVSTPQLIHDLYEEGGVCTDAADMLLEKMERHAV